MYFIAVKNNKLEDKINLIKKNKNFVKIDEITSTFCFLVSYREDYHFFHHKGIAPYAIKMALEANIKNRKIVAGGSTITQQLAKNLYFTFKRKFSRKIAELIMTIKLERNFSKTEILEIYLNVIEFGNNCYGIKEAANFYFNKEPKNLNFEESLLLSVIICNPHIYNPIKNPKRVRELMISFLRILYMGNFIKIEDLHCLVGKKIKLGETKEKKYEKKFTKLIKKVNKNRLLWPLPKIEERKKRGQDFYAMLKKKNIDYNFLEPLIYVPIERKEI